ncbi:unnamed protein product, partial [Mesorhabditis spiculigera]
MRGYSLCLRAVLILCIVYFLLGIFRNWKWLHVIEALQKDPEASQIKNQVIDVELGTNLGSKRTKDPLFTVMHEEPKTMSPREATEFERKQAADHGFELL